jgi:hypothetical protein
MMAASLRRSGTGLRRTAQNMNNWTAQKENCGARAAHAVGFAPVTVRRVCMSSNKFVCRNQSCGTPWEQTEVVIKNEGQGPLFRCPLCGARNYLEKFEDDEGNPVYEQVDGKPFL